jgi:hypothetical protein
MRTFPYQDGDRLIELVEKRELDAAKVEVARLTALLVTPNPPACGQCADKTLPATPPETA